MGMERRSRHQDLYRIRSLEACLFPALSPPFTGSSDGRGWRPGPSDVRWFPRSSCGAITATQQAAVAASVARGSRMKNWGFSLPCLGPPEV